MSNIEQAVWAEDAKIDRYMWSGRLIILLLLLGVGGWAEILNNFHYRWGGSGARGELRSWTSVSRTWGRNAPAESESGVDNHRKIVIVGICRARIP